MPKYEVKIEAWEIMRLHAEDEEDAQEQAIDHFHNNYAIMNVDVTELEADGNEEEN